MTDYRQHNVHAEVVPPERADRPGDQPLPVPNDRPSIQSLVRADLDQREQVGIQRYGTPLQAHNGRDAMRDAYEEALDLATYLRQVIEERKETAAGFQSGAEIASPLKCSDDLREQIARALWQFGAAGGGLTPPRFDHDKEWAFIVRYYPEDLGGWAPQADAVVSVVAPLLAAKDAAIQNWRESAQNYLNDREEEVARRFQAERERNLAQESNARLMREYIVRLVTAAIGTWDDEANSDEQIAKAERRIKELHASIRDCHDLQNNIAAVVGVDTDWDAAGRQAVLDAVCRMSGNLADALRVANEGGDTDG